MTLPFRSILAEVMRIAAFPERVGAVRQGFIDRPALKKYEAKQKAAREAVDAVLPDDWVEIYICPPEPLIYTPAEWCQFLARTAGVCL